MAATAVKWHSIVLPCPFACGLRRIRMCALPSRRSFLLAMGGAAGASLMSRGRILAAPLSVMSSRFKLSVITDEISQDFGHALEVAWREFGLGYVELRTLWDKNIINLDEKEIGEVH